MGQAIAAEINLSSQGNETNSKNVKFDVYLDETDRSVKEKTAGINSDEMKLYLSVSVQGGGYLNNPVIELVETNFRLTNNPEITKFKLDSIQSEKGSTAELSIIAKNDESYDLSLLDMQSQIRLTGEYIDANGNVTDIDVTKAVKISWTANELTEEDSILSQEVITNKIYNIDGANKRVIQVLVKSQIKDNKAPVKSSLIQIANPEIGVEPEEVTVAGYTTVATNGKTSLEFGDSVNSSWEYKAEDGKTYIQVVNNPSENNAVTWTKNSEDKFVVTYIYDESAKVASFISNVKSTTEIYGRTIEAIEKTSELKLEELAEIGDIAKLESSITKNIYKGKMYIGEDTNYQAVSNIYIPYSKIANNVVVEDLGDEIAEGISTYYKETKINKEEAIKVLGEEGTITVYNVENRTAPIKQIALSEEIEGDYYTISYDGNVNKISIEMSAAKAEGTIEIINKKAIKVSDTNVVAKLTELTSNTVLSITDANNSEIVKTNSTSTAKLVEPKTTFNISLDKTSISALSENDLRITAELISKDESNKLYKSPTINIELPAEVTEASVENITPVVGSDELKIKSYDVVKNDAGNKVIVINIQGEQTSYSSNAASIVIDAKVKTDEFMADKDAEIKTATINDGETVEKVDKISIVSKSGLVTKSTIKVGEDVIEKINQSNFSINAKENEEIEINAAMINNYGDTLSNGIIIGTIPEEGTLKSEITTSIKDAVVYYSEEANPNADSESWKTEVSSLEKVKSFKIVAASNVEQASELSINYKYETPNAGESTIKVSGKVADEAIEETLAYVINEAQEAAVPQSLSLEGETTDTEKLQVNVAVTSGGEEVTNGAEINNGQVLRYKVKVTNTSSETLNNIKLKATVKNGVFYDLVQCGVIEDLTKDENGNYIYPEGKPVYTYDEVKDMEYKEISLDKLESGKTSEFEYLVVAYIGDGENANKFDNNILITADNMQDINLADTKVIKEASLALKLKYGYSENVQSYSSAAVDFILEATNLTNSELQNVNLTIDLPDELDCNLEDQIFINTDENVTISKNGTQVNVVFKNIEANGTLNIKLRLKTNDLPYDELERNVTLKMTGNIGTNGVTYTSNDYIIKLLQIKSHITANLESDKMGETLKVGDKITYTATIKNDGYKDINIISIEDLIPNELNVISAKIVNTDGTEKDIIVLEDNHIYANSSIKMQDTIKLIIEAEVLSVPADGNSISNKITITGGEIETVETKELVNKVVETDTSNDPDDGNKEGTNSISGLAWLDENKDGIKNEEEKVLQAVEVILLDKEGKEVAKTTTSLTGTYKFTSVEQGEYTVAFVYDTSKYAVTKYQVSNATESTNSDAISKEIEINGEKKVAGLTDTIKVDGENITNIDIGLIENAKFDLSINKYIRKVVLSNSSGTTTYEYEDTNFTKVEISAKKIAGTVLLIEYELQITNEGDVDSYVGDVIDYLPDGLVFTSETNKDWYMDGSGILHNKTLAEQAIKAGETKSVTLVLTKTLKADSTGTIENIGEIGASSNKEGITEYDSIAGNKKTGEDDMSTASLIVSIATGSPIMYIGIVIGIMLVLGLGIYIINKKVLKVRI